MRVNLLRDADIKAISIVGKGANRKRFFLFKEDAESATELGHGRLLKSEDWSTVYCVVAEPGHHEDSGIGGPDVEDRWADEEEIRKAAHRFMANGGLVNKMHESLEPYGDLVENAVALADFTVNSETIKKGSWYVAITPNAEGKAAIEKGEFTGISIEGTAIREQVDKAIDFKAAAGPLRHLLAHYRKYPKPFTACVRDNTKRFGPRAKNICAGLKDIMLGTQEWRAQFKKAEGNDDDLVEDLCERWGKFGLTADDAKLAAKVVGEAMPKGSTPGNRNVGGVEKTLLKRIAGKVGLSDEEVAEIEKANMTFGEIIALREFDEMLPEAFAAFREAVTRAFFPAPGEDVDPVALISESCDEFKAWALDKLESVPVQKEARAEALGVDLTGSTLGSSSLEKESQMADKTPDNTERLEKLESTVETIGKGVEALLENAKAEEADKAPTVEDVTKQLDEVTKSVKKLGEDIAKLGEGDSSQPVTKAEGDEDVTADEVKKAYEDVGLSPDLAGIV